jgi:hypothetical protein
MQERIAMQRRHWLTVPAAAVLVAAAASAATANTYTVFSCKGPTGAPNGAAGWAAVPATAEGRSLNSCLASGPLTALLDAATPSGSASAGWSFSAPADTRIVRLAARRRTAGVAPPTSQSKDVSYVLETDSGNLEVCDVSGLSSCVSDLSQPIDKQGIDAALVRFRVLCTNAGLTCSRPLRADFDAVQIGLEDALPPTVSGINVLDTGDTSGTLAVGFSAADRGGGVYRAVVSVDGQPLATQPLGGAGCTDANPADADPYQFLTPLPCPASAGPTVVRVDAKSLALGVHGIQIAVEDAAGNSTTVVGPVQFPRANAEAVPGTVQDLLHARLHMWFSRNRKAHLTTRYGPRVVVRGRLRTPSGRGVRGARIDVYHVLHNGRRLVKTGLKTRGNGRLTLILPLNMDTRRILFAFRALRPGPITSRQTLRLTVKRHGRVFVRRLRGSR